MFQDVNTREAWHKITARKKKWRKKKKKVVISDKCKKYLGLIRPQITTSSYTMQVTYIWKILQKSTLDRSGCQLDNATAIRIQQCSYILLELLKALYHYHETLAIQQTQQCKYATFPSYHSLKSPLQPGSICHEISNSPPGNVTVLCLCSNQFRAVDSTTWISSCRGHLSQPSCTTHCLWCCPHPGNVLYLT